MRSNKPRETRLYEVEVIPESEINQFTGRSLPIVPANFKSPKMTREEVENSFHVAFELIGGVQRLALWADQNYDKFATLYAKLLPEPDPIKANAPTEFSITLKNGSAMPYSPLHDVEVRSEEEVNRRYLNNKESEADGE